MRLVHPFIRLLLRFDAEALVREIDEVPEARWRPHPEGMAGNTALPLLAANGDPGDDATYGPMRPTPVLARLPYTRQVLAGLGTVIGRTRLMRIDNEAEVTPHVDISYYWWDRFRVHVPVRTHPDVRFQCGDAAEHFGPGEAWVFDTWRRHRVLNPASFPRIHLVADTVGSDAFMTLLDRSLATPDAEPKMVPNRLGAELPFPYESVNRPQVMSPWEVATKVEELLREVEARVGQRPAELVEPLTTMQRAWRATWAVHGDRSSGWRAFDALRGRASRALIGAEGRYVLTNGIDVVQALRQLVLVPGVDLESQPQRSVTPAAPAPATATAGLAGPDRPAANPRRRVRQIQRPVIIVSSPRSGSSLLFETLARAPGLHSVGGESHQIIESIPALRPAQRGWPSNALGVADATATVTARLHELFTLNARDRDGTRLRPGQPYRLLEKTPKNALRVPFLADVFPDATFVYLYRDPRETISSMLDAWRSGRFVTYPDLPGWEGPPWSMVLTPGWRELIGRPLAEVVAQQWMTVTTHLLDDLEALPPERWCVASYDRLVADPSAEIGGLCEHLDLAWDIDLTDELPHSRHTLDSPHPDKWRRNAAELEPVWDDVREVARRAHGVFAAPPRIKPVVSAPVADAPRPADGPVRNRRPLRSVHTKSMAAVLEEIGSSLLVSTYQSGRVILVRPDGDVVNTHFRSFPAPMGMALDQGLLAIGTAQGIWVHQNQPAVAQRLEPVGRHDACYLPRVHHITGDIRIHDVAFAKGELWIVNTRFSCLATLDGMHSFVPRWRPPFITSLAAEDRCHLNGLTVIDDEVRFVTALGVTDEAGGWRQHKAAGGVLLDVPSGEVVLSGLSMPHSPRWHDGRLWILESGRGTLGVADLEAGTVETVAHLPGFTRGLAFAGPYAFVGLSKVREHVFGGIPLTEELDERVCGVWVVDLRSGGIVGFLRFEGAVEEIFDVQLLAGRRWPELVEPGADVVSGSFVLADDVLSEVSFGSR